MRSVVYAIDDDQNILDIYEALLLEMDLYDVKTCNNPKIALEEIEKNPPDVLLLDIMMPEMSGIDVMKKLKKIELKKPVIVISGQADRDIAVEIVKQGAYGFLEKPFDDWELEVAVKKAISHVKSLDLATRISETQKKLLTAVKDVKSNQNSKIYELENRMYAMTGNIAHNVDEKKSHLEYMREDRRLDKIIRSLEDDLHEHEENLKVINLWEKK